MTAKLHDVTYCAIGKIGGPGEQAKHIDFMEQAVLRTC